MLKAGRFIRQPLIVNSQLAKALSQSPFASPIGEKSFKSFQIIQIFIYYLFVRFGQICEISAPSRGTPTPA